LPKTKGQGHEDNQFSHIDNKGILNQSQSKFLKPTGNKPSRLIRSLKNGSMLIEMTVALALLTTIGIVVFKSTVDLISPRQTVLHQNVSEAYISYEAAYAERISFEVLTSDTSPWPVYPAKTNSTIEIGKLPGARAIMATVVRTRIADTNNLTSAGGSGTITTNPAEMESWRLESHMTYQIGDQTYVKSRSTVRTQ